MQQVNLHQQKLITVLIGIVGIIFLFLPWQKIQGGQSYMGFSIWGGIICGVAIVALIASCLVVGDRTKPFDKQGKMIAMICFGLMLLLTIIILATSGGTKQQALNQFYIVEIKTTTGIGVWLSLILELGGIAWVSGILNQLIQQKSFLSGPVPPSAPPPPPTPKA